MVMAEQTMGCLVLPSHLSPPPTSVSAVGADAGAAFMLDSKAMWWQAGVLPDDDHGRADSVDEVYELPRRRTPLSLLSGLHAMDAHTVIQIAERLRSHVSINRMIADLPIDQQVITDTDPNDL